MAASSQIWLAEYISLEQTESNRGFSNKNLPPHSTNPFRRDFSTSIPLYMAVTIIAVTNASLELEATSHTYPKLGIETRFLYRSDGGQLNEFTYISGLQFLSCYSESYITFYFYLTPFEPMLWLGLVVSLLIIFIALYFYITRKHMHSPYSVWLSFISVLFDDFSSVPEVIGNSLFYRLIFLTWAPAALLFTNCYSGLMISELNSPLKQTRSENF